MQAVEDATSLAFIHPIPKGGDWRNIARNDFSEIRLQGGSRKLADVRARTGYYAPLVRLRESKRSRGGLRWTKRSPRAGCVSRPSTCEAGGGGHSSGPLPQGLSKVYSAPVVEQVLGQ